MRREPRVRHTGVILILLGGAAVAFADDGDERRPPFVAGFERFGRHGEIPKGTAGRLLLTELNCTGCHPATSAALAPKRGPKLDGAGLRLRTKWVQRYLESPATVHPGTTMPDVLEGYTAAKRHEAAESIAIFLTSLRRPFPELKAGGVNPLPHEFWRKGDVDRGQELYHRVGCVACHEPDPRYEGGSEKPSALETLLDTLEPEELEALGLSSAARPVPSVPHGDLGAKYTREGLVHFLLDPTKVRPSGRMPNLRLEPTEAADLAAYLLRDANEVAENLPPVEPIRRDGGVIVTFVDPVTAGKRHFEERCTGCHDVAGPQQARPVSGRPLGEVRRNRRTGCLADPRRGPASYPLDIDQTEALLAAIDELQNAGRPLGDSNRVDFTMLRANCYACHERGKLGGVGPKRRRYFETAGHVDIGDEGRLPPALDHVGAKLTTAWLTKVLAGSGNVRPFVHARMPSFPKSLVGSLPTDLARSDEASDATEKDVFAGIAKLSEPGRELLDTGCVQCHPLNGDSVPGTVGVDLAGVTGRLRPTWFREFLHDPGELKSRTRMPTFFPNGKSANPTVLDGNVDRQIAAMWAYLKSPSPLPDKIAAARSADFELKPTEKPILLRTFVKGVGTHAIAVGFPRGVHVVFDAAGFRPAIAWRGRFLDAYGTWFSRFTPPAEPLGEEAIAFPPGVPLAVLADRTAAWPDESPRELGYRFEGYRFDADGVPTFLYRVGRWEVEDRLEPNGDRGFDRRIVVRSKDATDPLWFRLHAGTGLKVEGNAASVPKGMTVRAANTAEAVVRETEWLVPVTAGEAIEVEYRW